MKDIPIIFSGPMVRALIEGRKTMTRRLLRKPVPAAPAMDAVHPSNTAKHAAPYLDAYCSEDRSPANPRGMGHNWCWWTRDDRACQQFRVGYAPGDRLWVREAWRCNGWATDVASIFYRASEGDGYTAMCEQYPVAGKKPLRVTGTWRPGIHMPRWASRLTLIVTSVKIERLNDISDEDALAEGVTKVRDHCYVVKGFDYDQSGLCHSRPSIPFAKLWERLHGPESWDANPWVVAVSFTVQRANIGAMSAAA